jgi:hypothetical protein
MSWTVLEKTTKAVLFKRQDTYVVSIGNGKKPPPDHEVFGREPNGKLKIKGSYWTYRIVEGVDGEEIKQGAYNLYEKFC